MKKLILIVVALVMVASGVAAVSAYEAHVVNVTAHVENALLLRAGQTDDSLAPLELAYGTVFPQEWAKTHFDIELSTSFKTTQEVDNVTYELWAEWKPIPGDASPYPTYVKDIGGEDYYLWLGDALWVGTGADWPNDLFGDPTSGATTGNCPAGSLPGGALGTAGGLVLVGDPPAGPPMAKLIPGAGGVLDKTNWQVTIGVGLDVPAFEHFYNSDTDVCPKPSFRDTPTLLILDTDPRYHPNGVDLGIDLKVQVTDIGRP